jgi:hypothetical protein
MSEILWLVTEMVTRVNRIVTVSFRHPEVRAKRASKDAAEAPTEIRLADFGSS